MLTLLSFLQDYEYDLLKIIANRWDVDLASREPREAAAQLSDTMLDAERAALEWSRLNDRERGALQLLLAAKDHKMPEAQFTRLFGEIRQMGSEKRQREKPHVNPVGIAEVLYYRGLLTRIFDQGKAGAQPFVIVPGDLAGILPSRETGYDLEAEDDDAGDPIPLVDIDESELDSIQRSDTSLVDDITTLLAYLQIENVKRDGASLSAFDRQALEDYCLKPPQPARIALMIALIVGLGLAADNKDGYFKPVPAKARRWLDESRTAQVRSLVETWQSSDVFNELHHVPGLTVEATAMKNDPALIRTTLKNVLHTIGEDDWVPVESLLEEIKESEPDFQRPAADYNSWYIRDAETGDYLKGFENWDRIDGAVLAYTLTEPMYWLGLLDTGDSDGDAMVKLNAYGRAFAGLAAFPNRPNPDVLLKIDEEGVIFAPRAMSCYDRFQLARFTDWGIPGDPFEYQLNANSLQRADADGIKGEHILTFLKRTTNDNIPEGITRLLEQWKETGGASIRLTRMVVLETDTPEVLDTLLDTPELRRFLGARLGARAVVVREGQWDDMLAELQKRGMLVETDV